MKTNDVSGRVGLGEVGFTIELGRPGVGVRFYEIQEMWRALAAAGVSFEKKNPVTSLMSDVSTGTIREDILNEKVMSAIVEIKVPVERAEEIIRIVWEVERAHRHGRDDRRRRALRRERRRRTSWRRSSSGSATSWSAPRPTSGLGKRCASAAARDATDGERVTNTLHRFGDAESFHDDFIVFAMASKGAFKQPNALPALKRFLQIALEYKPGQPGRRQQWRRLPSVASP